MGGFKVGRCSRDRRTPEVWSETPITGGARPERHRFISDDVGLRWVGGAQLAFLAALLVRHLGDCL